MFARIISAICILYVAFTLLAPPCVQEQVGSQLAMFNVSSASDKVVAYLRHPEPVEG